MSIFQNKNRPRALHDLRIGKYHMVETLFQLRRSDWDWYETNQEDIEEDIFDLLSERIIPRMFGDEIEQYHASNHPEKFPDLMKNVVGSKNTTTNTNTSTANNKKGGDISNTGGGKSKQQTKGRSSGTRVGKTAVATLAAAAAAAKKVNAESLLNDKKPEKDIYFSFGDIVQLAYRKKKLSSFPATTVFYKRNLDDNDNNDEDNHHEYDDTLSRKSKFTSPIKLSERLLIWVSPLDPNNKTNPDPPGVGFFHRPEMIPITSLFREPKDLNNNNNNEDDNDKNNDKK